MEPLEYVVTTYAFDSYYPIVAINPPFCSCEMISTIDPPKFNDIVSDISPTQFRIQWYDLDILEGEGAKRDVDIIFTAFCGTKTKLTEQTS